MALDSDARWDQWSKHSSDEDAAVRRRWRLTGGMLAVAAAIGYVAYLLLR